MNNNLPNGRTDVIDLMPREFAATGREFLGIINEDVYVTLSPDPEMGDVYKLSAPRKTKNGWVSLYSPTDVGLRRFLLAGAVKEIKYDSQKEAPLIWVALYRGEYTLPNGDAIPLTGDYEFDCTERGPRWLVRKDNELHKLVEKWEAQRTDQKYVRLKDDGFLRIWKSLPEETKQEFTEVAEFTANKFVRQNAQYGRQRAQTGAIDRALRKFFLIRSYTQKELKTCAFHLVRTSVNYELMKVGLGVVQTRMLQMVDLLQARGLSEGVIGTIVGLLAEGKRVKQAAQEPAGFFMDGYEEEDVVEGEMVSEVNDEQLRQEARLYEIPAEKDTAGRAMQNMIHFYGWDVFNVRVANTKCAAFFGRKFRNLSEAEMRLFARAYEKLDAERNRGASKKEVSQMAAHLAEAMKRCVHEKRLWREPEEEAEQPELPGMETNVETDETTTADS